MNTDSNTSKTIELATAFKALGGMNTDSGAAIRAHEAIANHIDSMVDDWECHMSIATKIVENFSY